MKLSDLWSSGRYLAMMTFAAGIALVRGFFLAGILDATSFGLYVSIVAAGMFSSLLISFGENERTIKKFPRIWASQNNHGVMISQSDKSAKAMILRASIVLIFLLSCIFVSSFIYLAQMGIFVVLVALSAALASLYSSAIRASGDVEILAGNTLIRTMFVILLGVAGAFFFSWQGAILGEIFGALLGVIVTRYSVVKQTKLPDHSNVIAGSEDFKTSQDRGLWLFFAGLLATAPAYLDRTFVALVLGASLVGTFGFLMLFVTSANVFVGIVAQKIGPQLIKMEYLGDSVIIQIKYTLRWLSLIFLVCFLGMTFVWLTLIYGPAQYFYNKFHLNFSLIQATTALSMLQIGVLADFIMISRNQERAIFLSASWYLLTILAVVLIVIWLKLSLLSFIWLLALAKLIHIAVQVGFIGVAYRKDNC
ncbi:hypothetical protein MCEMSEM29_01151 [Methylophilaceae bacterium]